MFVGCWDPCLSFRLAQQCAEEGIILLFLFVLISRRPVLIARALCGLLNVTVEALCTSYSSSDQEAVSSDVAGSAAYVYSVHVYPQSRDLNQIQSTLSTFYRGPYRAGLWVSVDSKKNRKQTTSSKKIATQHSNKPQCEQSGRRLPSSIVASVRRRNLASQQHINR